MASLVLALGASTAHASCGSSECPLDDQGTAALGERFSLGISYQLIDQDRVQVESRRASVGELPSPEDEIRTLNRIATVEGRVFLTHRWALQASLPVVDRLHAHVANEADDAPRRHQFRYRGFGDLVLLNHWTVREANLRGGTSLTLQAGASLPTGRRHVPSIDGDEPEPPARPGTGAFGLLAGVHAMRAVRGRAHGTASAPIPFFASVLVRVNGKGTEGYRVGPELRASAGGSYPLLDRVRIETQVNARLRGKDDIGRTDATRANTGGASIYLSPGLRLQATPILELSGYVQIPVYERVNRIQLVAPYHLRFGATYRLGVRPTVTPSEEML